MWDKIVYHIVEFSKDFFPDLGGYLLKLILIVTAVVVVLEILKVLKILDFINNILYYFTKHLGISKSASMPLLIGILAGISYGAGAIISCYNNNDMNKKDVILVSTFLCICHALPEDTLLFVSVGAKGWIVLLVRFALGVIATLIANLIYEFVNKNKKNKNIGEQNANN